MGTKETHQKNRQRYRKRLRKQGFSEQVIDIKVNERRAQQLAERENDRERAHVWEQPDDRSYRPRSVDSLRTGAGRASGISARVAARRSTITKHQYDSMEAKTDAI